MNTLPTVHITDNSLVNPTNPVTVNLIGTGGTGSQMLTCLARMSQAMLALGHPGMMVYAYDDDTVSEANLGRQLFSASDIGHHKNVVLINRLNRFFGTNWKAVTRRYSDEIGLAILNEGKANIFISCVDSAKARFELAELLAGYRHSSRYEQNRPLYWLDLGNSRDTGQVVLSTIGSIKQPNSQKFQPVAELPFVTDTYRDLISAAEADDDTPSCSLAEALTKQDLFINSTLANMGASLLWQLFREGMISQRGFFLNLHSFRTRPIAITSPASANLAA